MRKTVVALMIVAFMIILIAAAEAQTSVGVKAGNWVEYSVETTGAVPAAQDLTWAKIEIVDIEGEAFHANFTVKYVNGTLSTSLRFFNFSAGNVQAWIIIPANLSPGQTFYDSSINSNVPIQGQIQKTVAGADRTVTYTNSTLGGVQRNKEWDKDTGFYIQSADNLGTYTVNAQAIATNIWSPQILGLNQNVFYLVVTIIVLVIAVIVVLAVISRKNKRK
ncbi:MAG TPA: hypothetical protein VLV84_02045 [Candidatus Acidoferrales bacterium]|nr:hypothetical protein [Candidatus Acidoferrales bacterium]